VQNAVKLEARSFVVLTHPEKEALANNSSTGHVTKGPARVDLPGVFDCLK
jgi:hypothetical protein